MRSADQSKLNWLTAGWTAATAASTEARIIGFENRRKMRELIATWREPLAGATAARTGAG